MMSIFVFYSALCISLRVWFVAPVHHTARGPSVAPSSFFTASSKGCKSVVCLPSCTGFNLLMLGELTVWLNARQSAVVFFSILILLCDLVPSQHTERCGIIRCRESGCASEIPFLAGGATERCPAMFCRHPRPSREAF